LGAVRPPAVSGRFYPGTRAELARAVDELLAAVRPGAHPAGARGAVAPHAGYVYSGMTAAHVFARLRLPRVVVILAPNHTGVCHAPGGASLWEAGAFATPLGDVPVDDAFAAALVDASSLVASDHDAHRAEHAVEVQLPFLLALRPDVRIVPLLLAWDRWDDCHALGDALAALARRWTEPVLLLASSDLNHYDPAAVGELKDARALAAVETLDGAELLGRCRRERISMCGRAPVATVLAATQALGATRADVVDYRHSGWVTGDESQVVGYGGVVIL
jgi:AmmeMemoRadiSam system protein B